VRRHSQATRVAITLEYRSDEVSLKIADNGAGSSLTLEELSSNRTKFGLIGLRERVEMLLGNMTIQTAPGQGFTVVVTLPTNLPDQSNSLREWQ